MKLSAKKIWRRHRKIWRILLLWAVLSLAILFCWAYSLNDGQGGFGRVNGGSRYTLAADEAQKMVINANGVKGSIFIKTAKPFMFFYAMKWII